jgi:DNA-binding protein H-NS
MRGKIIEGHDKARICPVESSSHISEASHGEEGKRRGRPPGSKNKVNLGLAVAKMDVGQLQSYIRQLEETLAAKVQQQREFLEGQLAGLSVYANNKAGAAVRAVMRLPGPKKRKKAEPKYRSKKDRKVVWSGRGMLPVWRRWGFSYAAFGPYERRCFARSRIQS